jgi:hypothetical protein
MSEKITMTEEQIHDLALAVINTSYLRHVNPAKADWDRVVRHSHDLYISARTKITEREASITDGTFIQEDIFS